jgi:hypothetical protein
MKFMKIIFIILIVFTFSITISAKKRQAPHITIDDLTDPKSPSYVPYPYPKNDFEIIEDLKYQLKKIYLHPNSFHSSSEKNPSPNLDEDWVKGNSDIDVIDISKVRNRFSRMSEEYTFLITLYDKKRKLYQRASLRLYGALMGGIAPSNIKNVNKLHKRKDVIKILSKSIKDKKFEAQNIKNTEYIYFEKGFATPWHRIEMNNGNVYFVDYHGKAYKKTEEKLLKGEQPLAFRYTLKKSLDKKRFTPVYDSIDDKALILERLDQN